PAPRARATRGARRPAPPGRGPGRAAPVASGESSNPRAGSFRADGKAGADSTAEPVQDANAGAAAQALDEARHHLLPALLLQLGAQQMSRLLPVHVAELRPALLVGGPDLSLGNGASQADARVEVAPHHQPPPGGAEAVVGRDLVSPQEGLVCLLGIEARNERLHLAIHLGNVHLGQVEKLRLL